jgi:hypothetical protein
MVAIRSASKKIETAYLSSRDSVGGAPKQESSFFKSRFHLAGLPFFHSR